MRIEFALVARFPTDRAYGVTTSGSIGALQEMGHEISVFARDSVFDYVPNRIKYPVKKFFEKYFNRKIIFHSWRVLFTIIYLRRINDRKEIELIWLRDPFVATILTLFSRNRLIFCEIHNLPSTWLIFVYRLLAKSRRVVLGPIKSEISRSINVQSKSVICGMAVTERFITVGRSKILDSTQEIIYIGNRNNVSYGADLSYLMVNLVKVLELHPNVSVSVVGIDDTAWPMNLRERFSKSTIRFFPYLDRDEIIDLLKSAKIGVVIYPDNKHYRSTFPIKIVEYAATRTAIVASDTLGHRALLGSNNAKFFSLLDDFGLATALDSMLSADQEIVELANKAFLWADDKTYHRRVKSVLDAFQCLCLSKEMS